jgi:sulfide:quinone oxidoreductase
MAGEARERKHIVVVGGGAAALESVIALRTLLGAQPAITIVAPNAEFVYQPLTVLEPFQDVDMPRLPLHTFAKEFHAVYSRDSLAAVTPDRSVELVSGASLPFDKLLIAIGAPRVPVYPEAITFRGTADVEAIRTIVEAVDAGRVRRLAFVVPRGVAWALPLYELALMIAARRDDLELALVTPEDRPLGVFGARPSADVEQRVKDVGIRLVLRATVSVPDFHTVVVHPGGETIDCDRVIALPVTQGPRVWGVPSDADGYIPIDPYGRVAGARDVYAAGDVTNFPLKQGGIACQQADAAAAHIAWSLGSEVEPEPFRPVLRGQLLTGDLPQYMRHDLTRRHESQEVSATHPLWWPATKMAGKHLSAYIAAAGGNTVTEIAPGVRRRGFLAPSADGNFEIPLRGYEYEARWGSRKAH